MVSAHTNVCVDEGNQAWLHAHVLKMYNLELTLCNSQCFLESHSSCSVLQLVLGYSLYRSSLSILLRCSPTPLWSHRPPGPFSTLLRQGSHFPSTNWLCDPSRGECGSPCCLKLPVTKRAKNLPSAERPQEQAAASLARGTAEPHSPGHWLCGLLVSVFHIPAAA